MTIAVCADEEAVATSAAERITALIEAAIASRRDAMVCLTGGRTPQRAYALLADEHRPWRSRIEWRHVHLFWGDERHVPPDHPDSNFGSASRALLSRVPVLPQHVHRIPAELSDASAAAREYEATVRRAFASARRTDLAFDIVLLGLGEDAHIASIFPGSPLLDTPEHEARVAAVWAPHLCAWRITLTPHALLDTRAVIVIVSGGAKAEAVHAALDLPDNVVATPVHILRAAADRVSWITDAAAAARRPAAPPS